MPSKNLNKIDQGGNRSTVSDIIYPVKVKHIILNGNEEGEDSNLTSADKWGGPDAVGLIFYQKLPKVNPGLKSNADHFSKEDITSWAGTARPLFPHIKFYPLINEIVLVLQSTSKN